jgi:hypothetical protein
MYLPFLIAKNMGEGITVQSTTLSPVQPFDRQDYAVRHAIIFEDLLQTDRANFVYNIAPDSYEEVFIFWEQKADPQAVPSLVQALKGLGIKNIVFVNFE